MICRKILNDVELSKATDNGIDSLIDGALIRKDDVHQILTEMFGQLSKETKGQKPYNVTIYYHRNCRANYTSQRNLSFVKSPQKHNFVMTKPYCLPPDSRVYC